jgi:ABC-2 type transport system ATP-binding protein
VTVLEAQDLGKRFGRTWALRECSLSIPKGCTAALVGPNGAGKTTLINCVVGLSQPTEGSLRVFGDVAPGSHHALRSIGFVAQDAPLYGHLRVGAMIEVAERLNQSFDVSLVQRRLQELGIRSDHRVGSLSGGQHAQLALSLALARGPELLVLDEPLARLDPLARHQFMAEVMAAVADGGLSVLFSSHVIAELERVADHLIVLSHGSVRVAGAVDDLLAGHRILEGPAADIDVVGRHHQVLDVESAGRFARLLVRTESPGVELSNWESAVPSVEEIVLAYLKEGEARASLRAGVPPLQIVKTP